MFRISTFAAAALALVAMPLVVLADGGDCPRGLAVDGVYLSFDDRVVRHQRLGDGNTAEMEVFTYDRSQFEYRTHPMGLYLESWEIMGGRIVAQSRETVTFSKPVGPALVPAPGLTWSATENARYADGSGFRYQTNVTVGQGEELAIGACTYASLPVRVERNDLETGDLLIDVSAYLAELGIVVHLGYNEVGTAISYDMPRQIGVQPPPALAAVFRTPAK